MLLVEVTCMLLKEEDNSNQRVRTYSCAQNALFETLQSFTPTHQDLRRRAAYRW
jgi:hypothetical protein